MQEEDPRHSPEVLDFVKEIQGKTPQQLMDKLRFTNNDDLIGWARYHFMGEKELQKPWQLIVMNRWLERDKFFRNILPQWLGTGFGLLSFVVAILALVVSMKSPGS